MSEYINIGRVRALAETRLALLIEDPWGLDLWVPKSQIGPFSEVKHKDQSGNFFVSSWWLDQKGYFEEREEEAEEPKPQPSTPEDLRLTRSQSVYRRLAMKYHPDRSAETAEFMVDLNELWQAVLADVKAK